MADVSGWTVAATLFGAAIGAAAGIGGAWLVSRSADRRDADSRTADAVARLYANAASFHGRLMSGGMSDPTRDVLHTMYECCGVIAVSGHPDIAEAAFQVLNRASLYLEAVHADGGDPEGALGQLRDSYLDLIREARRHLPSPTGSISAEVL